jgi:hypothetical protein
LALNPFWFIPQSWYSATIWFFSFWKHLNFHSFFLSLAKS